MTDNRSWSEIQLEKISIKKGKRKNSGTISTLLSNTSDALTSKFILTAYEVDIIVFMPF